MSANVGSRASHRPNPPARYLRQFEAELLIFGNTEELVVVGILKQDKRQVGRVAGGERMDVEEVGSFHFALYRSFGQYGGLPYVHAWSDTTVHNVL